MNFSSLLKTSTIAGAMVIAAALPAKADWSGLYIGASVGYVWSDDVNWVYTNGNTPQSSIDIENAIVGGHFGIQHQWGQIVVGLEASYNGRIGDDKGSTALCPNPAFTCSAGMNTVFTVGPRLGWAPNHQWLLYVTGGYAGAYLTTFATNGVTEEKSSAYHDGWFIGGGVEFAIHRGWVLGVEYRHYDLSREFHEVFNTADRSIDAEFDSVTFRLSYKWGRTEEAPLK